MAKGGVVELFQLEQFVAIAKHRTMMEAAQSLHISQSALSHTLKKLEHEIGCPLFERAHNRMIINRVGETLLAHAERVIADMKELEAGVAESRRLEGECIHVGSFSLVAACLEFPQITNMFPDTEFEVRVVDKQSLADSIESGCLDMVIDDEPHLSEDWQSEPLYEERMLLSVPKDSPVASKNAVQLDDLAELELLYPCGSMGLTSWYESLIEKANVPAANVHGADVSTYLAKSDTVSWACITSSFMSRFIVPPDARVLVPVDDPSALRTVYLSWLDKGNPMVDDIASFVRSCHGKALSGNAFFSILLNAGSFENFRVKH